MMTLVIISFVLFLVLRFPIAFALGLSCLIYVIVSETPLVIIPLKMYSGIDSFVLLSIPGFILAGNLMNSGGLTEKIIVFCNHLLGHIRGGLAMANVGACMLFAGITGTAISETTSIGSVMIPAMKKEGYHSGFACAVTASASTVGPIIPPSVPMIIAGTISGLSVGKLFLAGAMPGIMLGFGMAAVAYIISVKNNYKTLPRSSFSQIIHGFKDTFWAVLMTFIILFGIVGGIFTPTEASIVAVMYALFVGLFIYRKISWRRFLVVILESMKTSASLMILVGFANLFGWILITEQLPQKLSMEILNFSTNKYVVLLIINILLIFVGMFMETLAALLILFPILLKVAVSVGVEPMHFAIIMVLNLVIGLTTPPVGVCLFVASSIGKTSILQVSKSGLPFLAVSLLVLTLVTLFPQISLFLPGLLMK